MKTINQQKVGLNKEAYIRYNIIDSCISNKYAPYPTIEEIIAKCEDLLGKEFSKSTIEKDIRAMREDELLGFNAPIKYSKKHKGYYYTNPDYTIKKIPLNTNELTALEAVSDVLNIFSGSRIGDNYNQAVKKIFASLKEKKQEIEDSKRIIQTDEQINHKGFENFDLFYYAITNKIPINFIHYSYHKLRYNSIIAHPFMLKEFQNNWYLLAFSEEHNELRTFGLDRIEEPLFLDKEFKDIDNEIIKHYYDDIYGVFPVPGEKKQKITFVCNSLFSKYLKSNPIHKSQKIIDISKYGSTVFELELYPSYELINYFMQYHIYIKVIEPIFIIDEIYENAEKITKLYKRLF